MPEARKLYKLCFYVPESHLEPVKSALFAAGAGRVGDYEHCCWQTVGMGQFRPLVGSQPHIGELGQLEQLAEYKVEMVVAEEWVNSAREALLLAHPYEEPAYDLWPLSLEQASR
ncbi:NGG1p interacting factor NIF3 [Halieaceae bacterium IMCC14734]|uniref:NGG1p interacting factor NIF3 n=1 Tax=Candidatus Litorirhabdus singularis TaxID=2518993 RepID=A0ABT3THL6_9GAMM|nr:YqfO family protein [Candidatus Litorirhabdus singularis]MCX2981802.1 NGG1p interacting factor NIF3 [Candidatus Litorirhabdus singularis]